MSGGILRQVAQILSSDEQAGAQESTFVPHSVRNVVERLFHELDSNRNGRLESEDLRSLLQTLGRDGDQLLDVLYRGGNASVDLPVFGEFMVGLAKASFDRLDNDGSGFLEATELSRVAGVFGVPLQTVMQGMDNSGDGRLDKEEYVVFLMGFCMDGVRQGSFKQGIGTLLSLGGASTSRAGEHSAGATGLEARQRVGDRNANVRVTESDIEK